MHAMAPARMRTALVTGAGQGIGEAVAWDLATRGHCVGIVDRNAAKASAVARAIRDSGGMARDFAADVSQAAQVQAAVVSLADQLGPPEILVNVAGFARDAEFADMTLEQWDDVLGVHLRGSFLTIKAASAHMIAARWGRIINISSISALGGQRRANYSAAKAGMHGLIKSLAVDLGPAGITANVVAPGFTDTAMTADTARLLGRSLEEHRSIAAASLPVRRFGKPADVAHAVAFFADEASSYITGQVLYVSGAPHG